MYTSRLSKLFILFVLGLGFQYGLVGQLYAREKISLQKRSNHKKNNKRKKREHSKRSCKKRSGNKTSNKKKLPRRAKVKHAVSKKKMHQVAHASKSTAHKVNTLKPTVVQNAQCPEQQPKAESKGGVSLNEKPNHFVHQESQNKDTQSHPRGMNARLFGQYANYYANHPQEWGVYMGNRIVVLIPTLEKLGGVLLGTAAPGVSPDKARALATFMQFIVAQERSYLSKLALTINQLKGNHYSTQVCQKYPYDKNTHKEQILLSFKNDMYKMLEGEDSEYRMAFDWAFNQLA